MASGYGAKGGVGRCYGFFADLSYCMTQSKHLEECHLFQEDYLECLHHQKETQRNRVVNKGVAFVKDMNPDELRHFHGRFAQRYRQERQKNASPKEVEAFVKEDEIFSHLPPESQDAANEELFRQLISRFQLLAPV